MLKQNMQSKSATCHTDKAVYVRGLCKSCYNKWLRENNPEFAKRQRENHDRWLQSHREQKKKTDKNWRFKQDSEYNHVRKLRSYQLTPDDYDRLLKSQDGVCAICGKSPKGRLHIDHNHDTGEVRGLLCFRCNFGLSYFSENYSILQKASEYLATSQEREDVIRINRDKRHKKAAQELVKLQKIVASNCTRAISSETKLEIKQLHDQGVKLRELCERYPKYSRSALYRASRGTVIIKKEKPCRI